MFVAVVVEQIYCRYRRGQTPDTRFADFGRRAVGLIKAAWSVSQGYAALYPRIFRILLISRGKLEKRNVPLFRLLY